MDRTRQLISRAHEGDHCARECLVKENLGLVRSIIRRFRGRGTDDEDLFQIGSIGLLKAIDKFDLSYEVKFSTYAVPVITGEIKRFLRDDGMLKVSRNLKEIAMRAAAAREELYKEMNREPTVEEISSKTGVEKELLVQALEAAEQVESLQKVIYEGDGRQIYMEERLEDMHNENELMENRIVLMQLLSSLEEKEKQLICLRYFAEKTQMEVARQLGISQVQVSRLEKKILGALRKQACK